MLSIMGVNGPWFKWDVEWGGITEEGKHCFRFLRIIDEVYAVTI